MFLIKFDYDFDINYFIQYKIRKLSKDNKPYIIYTSLDFQFQQYPIINFVYPFHQIIRLVHILPIHFHRKNHYFNFFTIVNQIYNKNQKLIK